MQLQIKSAGRWRKLMTFSVEHTFRAKRAGHSLCMLAVHVEEPIELRIVDSMDVAVWANIGHGWHVPKSAEGYTCVP